MINAKSALAVRRAREDGKNCRDVTAGLGPGRPFHADGVFLGRRHGVDMTSQLMKNKDERGIALMQRELVWGACMPSERSVINCRLSYSTKDLSLSDNHKRILEVVSMQLTSPERVLYDGRNSEGCI
jgi:hypothetical protein